MAQSFLRSKLLLVLFVSSLFAHAQGTKLWSPSSYADLEQGTPDGVAIRSDGVLLPAAAAKLLLTTPAATVWSVAVDAKGNAYLGTGSPAMVLKVTPDGKSTRLLETKDISVQVVRLGPDGMLYAATLPHGKVYRIDPNAVPAASVPSAKKDAKTGTQAPASTTALPPVIFDSDALAPKPTYIWDLAFDSAGRLYIATGGPAAIYRIGPKRPAAKPETFFSSQEQHIRCLLFAKDGTLYAGSDGRGLVYRIAPDGNGFVLFESPKREIPALALDPAGNLYVAALGDKHISGLPPLSVHSGPSVTATVTILAPGSIQSSSDNTLLPDGTVVYQLAPDGAPRELWASKDDILYALAWNKGTKTATPDKPAANQPTSGQPAGLLAASGNQGHLYRIDANGTYADVAHLEAKQATALATSPDGTEYVATSNTGRLYRLGTAGTAAAKDAEATYTSEIFDAKFFSRWGRATVRGLGNYDLMARSGNIEQPEQGWSQWEKVAPNAGPLSVPSARFLQWKAVLHPEAQISEVGIYYLPQNVAPAVDEIVVKLHARVNANLNPPQPPTVAINFPSDSSNSGVLFTSDASSSPLMAMRTPSWATVRWKAHDDNGDHLRYSLYYRGDGEANWQLLARDLKEDFASFDMQRLPDGGYTLRVVASDAPSNPPGEALTGYKDSPHFVIDSTPPVLSAITARVDGQNIHVTLDAKDALSSIARAYYSVDAGPWQYVAPVGKLSDALEEQYDFTLPLPKPNADTTLPPSNPQQHVIALRVVDSAGNAATGKVVVAP
jgi:sugar lactone lactonase YvrE